MQGKIFTLGNNLIEQVIYFEDGIPYKNIVKNKASGMEWSFDDGQALFSFPGIDLKGSDVSFTENQVLIRGRNFVISWEFSVFDDLPVIESSIGIKGIWHDEDPLEKEFWGWNGMCKACGAGMGSVSNHVILKTYSFRDRTDYTNYLLEEKMIPLTSWGRQEYDGHILVLREDISREEYMVVKNAPGAESCIGINGIHMPELAKEEYMYSYPVAVGVCSQEQSTQLFRKYYEKTYPKKTAYIMSNTWGGGNGDSRVCEAFVLKEIEVAAQLGIDIVQIDDGWQEGITANSQLQTGGVWTGGYRLSNPGFWEVNRSKFPHGLDGVVKAAADKNITIGLWFAPDSTNDYEAWEQDADVMLDFYEQYGIRYFKLDSIVVENRKCEENILRMLTRTRELSGGNIVFNMDITNGKRFGYLMHRSFGDLFVENRYTKYGTYYPHNTLRNLWDLSRFIPTGRLQMEVLDNQKHKENYSNVLAPSEYDIDYLFAIVMTANPLMWMELSELNEESKTKLSKIIEVYKKYREDFIEVEPILQRPSGFSRTGFRIHGRQQDYVLLFRELAETGEFNISVREILATNDGHATKAPVTLTREKTYLFGVVDRD